MGELTEEMFDASLRNAIKSVAWLEVVDPVGSEIRRTHVNGGYDPMSDQQVRKALGDRALEILQSVRGLRREFFDLGRTTDDSKEAGQ